MGLLPKLWADIAEVIRSVESVFGISLRDEDFHSEDREEILHVFLHEACHAAVSKASPWIHDLPEDQHTLIDETAARLLEAEIATRLGLYTHSIDEHVEELAFYGFTVPTESYRSLVETWETLPHTVEGIDRLVHVVRDMLLAPNSG
jgi:uncharacterized protein (DUF2342 family)